ncbi:tetratricopeptide repeat protein [Acetobacteraceae bacterium ESL0709]|nr:tetratricopeptide repeat protein [Acetobacteraceae bacterium ESL0697]MDF7677327.1 tetratricopeptide repeat protein [Acetobacteraceae bacterium ESL0709]
MTGLSFLQRLRTPKPRLSLPYNIAEIYEKATNGYVLEQVLWGKILLDSIYCKPDHIKARQWFLIAAQSHYGPAYNMLGRCSHFGWGCQRNLTEAVKYYEKAASLGDLWGCYNLGIMTLRGLGTKPDRAQAYTLFRKAALKGHAKSMNLMARFMEEGWETPRDHQSALEWYKRSAKGGDYRGQHNYATALVAQGKFSEALEWWEKAVETATTDILLAMKRELENPLIPHNQTLMTRLEERLREVIPSSSQI